MDHLLKDNLDKPLLGSTRALYSESGTNEALAPKTFIVLGSGRGGTSMVAGAMSLLGIPMDSAPYNFYEGAYNGEDIELVAASRGQQIISIPGRNPVLGDVVVAEASSRISNLVSILDRRNSQHHVWGFKDPNAYVYLPQIRDFIRNPHFVVVFRDAFAVAERETLGQVDADITQSIEVINSRYKAINAAVASWRVPTLLISYERSTIDRTPFIKSLSSFLGLSPTEAVISDACSFISPERGYKQITLGQASHLPNGDNSSSGNIVPASAQVSSSERGDMKLHKKACPIEEGAQPDNIASVRLSAMGLLLAERNEKIGALTEDLRNAGITLADLTNQANEDKELITNLLSQKALLAELVANRDAYILAVNRHIAALEAETSKLGDEITTYSNDISVLRGNIINIESIRKNLTLENAGLSETAQNLMCTVENRDRYINALLRRVGDIEAQLKLHQETLASANIVITNRDDYIAALVKQRSSHTDYIRSLELTIDGLSSHDI